MAVGRGMRFRVAAVLAAIAVAAASCGDDDDGGGADPTGTAVSTASTAIAADGEAPENGGTGTVTADGEFSGTTVNMLGAFVDADAAAFDASVADFEAETGINIEYTGSGDFTTLITTQVEAGTPPDIAFFPNPGQIIDFASRDEIRPVSDATRAAAEENYIDSWLSLGTYEDELYGVAYKASVKSIVWYSPSAFADAGYEVPTTWAELETLVGTIVADGGTPWCVGFESAEASGWPGTDWIEDIVLRQQTPEYYDRWVAHEIPFDDEGVKEAFTTFSDLVLAEDHTFGGGDGIVSTFFGDAMAPMFTEGEPGCYLHRQASFFTSFLPDGTTIGPDGDVDVFILPGEGDGPPPIMGGGDFAVAFSDRPEVDAVMQFLATPEAGTVWAGQGGYVAPYKTFDTSLYPPGVDQVAGEAMASADVFRFDGSDAMPGPVQPEFWAAMMNLATGASIDDVTESVEAAFE